MRLEFESISIENFKAIAARQVLHLAERGCGLHFVRGANWLNPRLGSNGVGKSTLWSALCWALFGKTVENLRNPDIRPWTGDRSTSVSLKLRINDRPHQVTRTTFPNRLLLNNRVVDQAAIDKLIGLTCEVFTHTIVLGQGRPLFFDLAPRDKLELFTDVLNLDRWERRSQLAADQVRELGQQIFNKTIEQETKKDSLARNEETLASVLREHSDWEAQQAVLLQGVQTDIKRLEEQLTSLQRQRDGADLAYDGAMFVYNSLRTEQQQVDDYLAAANHELDVRRLQIQNWKSERDRLRDQLDTLGQDGSCPLCGQSVKGTQLAHHRRELKQQVLILNKRINAGIPNALESQLSTLRQQLERIRTDIDTYRKKADSANDVMLQLDPQLADIKARLEQLRLAKSDRARTHNPFQIQVQNLRRTSRNLDAELDDVKQEIDKYKRQQIRRQFWVKGFKEVRLYVIDEILRDLELASNIRLEEFGLLGWSIRYNIDRETQSGTIARALNVTILSPQNRKAVRFESWSGGEGQRLRLIGALALADVLLAHAGVQTRLTVLDEPTQHLSMVGINDLVDSLHDWARYSDRSVFFTDHRVLDSNRFTSTLTVTRDHKGVHLA